MKSMFRYSVKLYKDYRLTGNISGNVVADTLVEAAMKVKDHHGPESSIQSIEQLHYKVIV